MVRLGPLDEPVQHAHVRVIGHDPVLARQVGAQAAQPERRRLQHDLDRCRHVVDGDAFAQVAELDHQDHVVAEPCVRRGPSRAAMTAGSVLRLAVAVRTTCPPG